MSTVWPALSSTKITDYEVNSTTRIIKMASVVKQDNRGAWNEVKLCAVWAREIVQSRALTIFFYTGPLEDSYLHDVNN